MGKSVLKWVWYNPPPPQPSHYLAQKRVCYTIYTRLLPCTIHSPIPCVCWYCGILCIGLSSGYVMVWCICIYTVLYVCCLSVFFVVSFCFMVLLFFLCFPFFSVFPRDCVTYKGFIGLLLDFLYVGYRSGRLR